MRVVLDANVFISGIFWEGNFCSQIIDKWREGVFELVSSLEIIEELVNTLLSFKIQMPAEMVEEWEGVLVENSVLIEPSIKLNVVEDDFDDNKFIEAAVCGGANLIVSQDKHLLKLEEYEGIGIVTPEEAVGLICEN